MYVCVWCVRLHDDNELPDSFYRQKSKHWVACKNDVDIIDQTVSLRINDSRWYLICSSTHKSQLPNLVSCDNDRGKTRLTSFPCFAIDNNNSNRNSIVMWISFEILPFSSIKLGNPFETISFRLWLFQLSSWTQLIIKLFNWFGWWKWLIPNNFN